MYFRRTKAAFKKRCKVKIYIKINKFFGKKYFDIKS